MNASHDVPRRLAAMLLPALLCTAPVAAQRGRDQPTPADSGVVERVGVSLILLDVEVTDAEGRPIHGLTRDDFRVTVGFNQKSWTVQSADDLCPCRAGAPTAGAAPAAPVEPDLAKAGEVAADPRWAEAARTRYVVYLDYSQLRQDGRHRAIEELRRWLREVKQPEDEVMLAAFSSRAGIVVLGDFTTDGTALLAAAERSYQDPEMNDTFPDLRDSRIEECARCCAPRSGCNCEACWYEKASQELSHTRQSFEGLRAFLERLTILPGRKALLLFHQDATMFPGRYYPLTSDRDFLVGDLVQLADELGAEANLARTTIHAAFSGETGNPLAVNLGANLADFTGGSYNRSVSDLAAVTGAARRDCACIYRLGLLPRKKDDRSLRKVTVEVQGKALAARYVVRHIGESERWWRESRAVLAEPARALDFVLVAAVVPHALHDGRWAVKLQVALSAGSIGTLPQGRMHRGDWEVGALLAEDDGGRSWEMLGVSELLRSSAGETTMALLHEQIVTGLRPGAYELRAFARDRLDAQWGGALTEIELPPPGEPVLAGPLMLRGGTRFLRAALPFRKGPRDNRQRSTELGLGSIPIGERPIVAGEPLEFLTLVCAADRKDAVHGVQRFVSRGGEPLFRFDEPRTGRAGDCATLHDDLDTTPIEPGEYVYHVRWTPLPGIERQAQIAFRIARPSGSPPENTEAPKEP